MCINLNKTYFRWGAVCYENSLHGAKRGKRWKVIIFYCLKSYLSQWSTHEYVSKLLGKETIDTNTYGQTKGKSGSYSTNFQTAGRELMTPDEVRMLDNQYALLFVRGEKPVKDLKYEVTKHPNISLTADGGAEIYRHGQDKLSKSTIEVFFDEETIKQAEQLNISTQNYTLLSEEELEEQFK